MITNYNFPTRISFGPGAVKQFPDVLKEFGTKRPFVIMDKDLSGLDVGKSFIELLKKSGTDAVLFCGSESNPLRGNPLKSHVLDGISAYKESGSDSIIGFGGGAALDVCKTIAMMVHHPGDLYDYEDGVSNASQVDKKIPPIFCIPTTAGTGSEVGRATVISDDETKVKRIFFSPRLMPSYVVLDPELTLGLPKKITAATGLDALTHLVEAYLAPGFNPLTDGIALEGIKLLDRSLVEAVKNGTNLEARGLMQNAAMMGAVAFQKGLGVTHSIAHGLSAVCDMHHGLGNGILIPYCMEFNRKEKPPKGTHWLDETDRFKVLADTVGTDDFVSWLVKLNKEIGIPKKLSDAGLKKDKIDKLIEVAFKDPVHQTNYRPVTKNDIASIVEAAF